MHIRALLLYSFIYLGLTLVSCKAPEIKNSFEEGFKIRTGVNISHWLSQSGKRGEERKNYIVEADFDTIAAMGFDHVRIPIDEMQLWDESGNPDVEAFELLHNAIKWSVKNNLRIIVDLHIIRSHYFNAEEKPLWTDPAEREKLVDLWKQLSLQLKSYPNTMLAYEILNEAVADDAEDWNKLIDKVVTSIRITEPERMIVIGSNRWQNANTFPEVKIPANDKNILLSFHFYTPMAVTHHTAGWTPFAEYDGPVNYPGLAVDSSCYKDLSPKALEAMRTYSNGYFDKKVLAEMMMPAIKVAKEYNLPLYCGEYGIYPTIPEETSLRWYKDVCELFNENNIAYAHWGYKGDFPVVGENSTPNKKLVSVLTAR